MRLRGRTRWEGLLLAAALLLPVGAAGCARSAPPRAAPEAGRGAAPVDPARVYAGYRFDSAPNVLCFGIQPLWIPTCVIWEVMARDERMQADVRRAGCRLDAFSFFKGKDVNDYLRDGKIQGGMGGDLPALKAATQFDVRIVGLVQQGPCSLIARAMIPLPGLRGRRIGYARGSNAHYTLLRVLRDHGLHPEDVRLVPLEVMEMADALAAGRIDAFSAWEPAATLALLDHPDFEVLARTEARGFLYFSRAFYERRPAVVRALVAAEVRALHWLGTNDKNLYIASGWAREHAVAFGRADLPLTAYDFLRLAHRDILRIPTAPRLEPELLAPSGALAKQFRLARVFGLLAADADWERVRQSFVSVEP
jgi:ABC-type nitrate/sulfonate/bicarbonate transport system substrate-binding protein